MDEPKENKCEIDFKCPDIDEESCIFFKPKTDFPKYCGYRTDDFKCDSAAAKVNRMTLELKRLGVEM